tara:strand:+ start:1094 stop:1330 length:237 start_codon:yes stop_codon:yes gene_type:complete
MKKLDLDTIATIRNGLETLLAILDNDYGLNVAQFEAAVIRLLSRLDRALDQQRISEEEKDLNEELAGKYADFTHAQEE